MTAELEGPSRVLLGALMEKRLQAGRPRGQRNSQGLEEGKASRCEEEGARLERVSFLF